MAVFWVVALMMEAARTSETLVNFYQTTRHYNPHDSHLNIRVIKSGRTRLTGHVALNLMRNAFTILVGKPEVK
jgi:hypothetical protein